jgi:hypothetical protein
MAASREIVSGVGNRFGQVFILDENGLPFQDVANATMYTGMQIEGIKTLANNQPDPQKITHYGDDVPYAQDSLAPTEIESFTITTSKTNLALDAYLVGGLVKNIGNAQFVVGDSDNLGSEPLTCSMFYRQALDTVDGSPTFGKLRQWNGRIYPSGRITPKPTSYEQGATDNTYSAVPTSVTTTPWGEEFDGTTSWGANAGAHIDFTMNYQPRMAVGKGNGTITSWNLPSVPVSASEVLLWIGGSLTVPGSITFTPSAPAVVISPAVGAGTQILAIVGSLKPPALNSAA